MKTCSVIGYPHKMGNKSHSARQQSPSTTSSITAWVKKMCLSAIVMPDNGVILQLGPHCIPANKHLIPHFNGKNPIDIDTGISVAPPLPLRSTEAAKSPLQAFPSCVERILGCQPLQTEPPLSHLGLVMTVRIVHSRAVGSGKAPAA